MNNITFCAIDQSGQFDKKPAGVKLLLKQPKKKKRRKVKKKNKANKEIPRPHFLCENRLIYFFIKETLGRKNGMYEKKSAACGVVLFSYIRIERTDLTSFLLLFPPLRPILYCTKFFFFFFCPPTPYRPYENNEQKRKKVFPPFP